MDDLFADIDLFLGIGLDLFHIRNCVFNSGTETAGIREIDFFEHLLSGCCLVPSEASIFVPVSAIEMQKATYTLTKGRYLLSNFGRKKYLFQFPNLPDFQGEEVKEDL